LTIGLATWAIISVLKALLFSKQILSVADQILLSLANLVASYLLLTAVGVEIFGLYSFLMVVCNLISGSFGSTLHGQMTLRIAGKRERIIQASFLSTFLLYVCIFGMFAALVAMALAIPYAIPYFEGNKRAIAAAGVFAFLLSLFDLFRKYAYVKARQDISLMSTVVYFVLLISGMLLVELEESSALWTIFIIFCVSKTVALSVNYLCIAALFTARRMSLSARMRLLATYWSQGQFSFLGMLTSWVQNQGITPFLMVVAGPLIVGYFNLARLLTVPVTVVNTGLINAALPRLRETFNKEGLEAVARNVSALTQVNMGLSALYFTTLAVCHYTGLLDRIFPDYQNAVVFLLLWSVVAMTLLYRSWLTQQYAVAMKFRFLLMVGIVSATITYVFIALLYFTTQNYYMVPVAVWLGETVLIIMLMRQRSRVLVV